MTLIGASLVTGSIVGELFGPSGHFLRISNYADWYLTVVWMMALTMVAGGLSLIAGVVLWLLSYRLDRVRDPD